MTEFDTFEVSWGDFQNDCHFSFGRHQPKQPGKDMSIVYTYREPIQLKY